MAFDLPVGPVGPQWFDPTVSGAAITAEYGQKPKDPSTTWKTYGAHTGIDYGVKPDSPAYAISNGKVVKVGFDKGVGNYVTLETSPGNQVTYEHLNKYGVKVGQNVTGGFQIGNTGNTGSLSEGAHLHTEYNMNGKIVSPQNFYGKSMPSWVQQAKDAPSVLGNQLKYANSSDNTVGGTNGSEHGGGLNTNTGASRTASFNTTAPAFASTKITSPVA